VNSFPAGIVTVEMETGIFIKALSILPLEMIVGFIPELLLNIASENDAL